LGNRINIGHGGLRIKPCQKECLDFLQNRQQVWMLAHFIGPTVEGTCQ
jgi:hypothetical protein